MIRILTFIAALAFLSSTPGCVATTTDPDDLPEEERLVPANEALELMDESGLPSITNVRGMMPLLLRDHLQGGPAGHDEPELLTNVEATSAESLTSPVLYNDGTFGYKGGIGGKSYNVVVSTMCRGYERNFAEASRLTGSGHCEVVGWYSQDISDCRAVVHVGVAPFGSGTCSWKVYANQIGYYSYTATNTNSAQQNTIDTTIPLVAGNVIEVGTCGLPNATASGDTYLRLIGPGGQPAALNDDACSSFSSYLIYTVPPGGSGKYTLRAGCYSSSSCSGTVAWQIR